MLVITLLRLVRFTLHKFPNFMNDSLGDRMKGSYENRTRSSLPRRTYTIIRIDGKAFHTYTKGCNQPFDDGLIEDMDKAVMAIMPQIQGAQFAYVQSDEVSILLTDFEKETTNAWFDGNVQKICSVSASLMTAQFNRFRLTRDFFRRKNFDFPMGVNADLTLSWTEDLLADHFKRMAAFDARTFTIPDPTEVANYFIWRNQDAMRNSLSMIAQSIFSHAELQGKSGLEMYDMIQESGVNIRIFSDAKRNGRLIVKRTPEEKDSIPAPTDILLEKYLLKREAFRETKGSWAVEPAWIFTDNQQKLKDLIPRYA
jgi:tRNA(His) guanylyltransferase